MQKGIFHLSIFRFGIGLIKSSLTCPSYTYIWLIDKKSMYFTSENSIIEESDFNDHEKGNLIWFVKQQEIIWLKIKINKINELEPLLNIYGNFFVSTYRLIAFS